MPRIQKEDGSWEAKRQKMGRWEDEKVKEGIEDRKVSTEGGK